MKTSSFISGLFFVLLLGIALTVEANDLNGEQTATLHPPEYEMKGGLQSGGFAISAKMGTLGYGFDLTKAIIPNLNVRFGLNHFLLHYEGTQGVEQIAYDVDVRLKTFSFLLDWHPFKEKFRLSAGVFHNSNEMTGIGVPTKTYTIGGKMYTPAKLGNVDGTVDFQKYAPYLGVGLGNAVVKDKRFGFVIDLGVVFQNSPQVTLKAQGLLEPTAEQEGDVEDDIKNLKFYPVFSMGLTYRLF